MATWSDIESNLHRLEDLDEAKLEELSQVMPPLSFNRNFDRQFDQAQLRIRHQLDRLRSERFSRREDNLNQDKWYKKPIGIIALTVGAGVLVAVIKYLLGI
ncbi:MAG TPA: hypothetical protein VFA51_09540 [Candidatus Udaeobacter sp.]|nr:hypothetical protein [Candidatus Udaeobacter sp.]